MGKMPGEPPKKGGGFSIPSFFDSMPIPPPPPPHAMEDMMAMFGSHIPEEPPRAREGAGDFGVKLSPEKMPQALKDGTVNEAAVTRAAGRVLYEIVNFGYMDGMQKHDVTAQDIDANTRIIEKTGEDAAVLLKNEGGALPSNLPTLIRSSSSAPPPVRSIPSASTASARLVWRGVRWVRLPP